MNLSDNLHNQPQPPKLVDGVRFAMSAKYYSYRYIYILLEKDKKFQIGYAENLNRRIQEHSNRKVQSIKKLTSYKTCLLGRLFKLAGCYES